MDFKAHWERVYTKKPATDVSWFQEHAYISQRLIAETGAPKSASIIDVGGGASTLIDDLLADGYQALTVLDLSSAALAAAKARLGLLAERVRWIEADITAADLPHHSYDIWHDRAVFHFLTNETDRRAYVERVRHAVRPGGHVIVATFAEDGPATCSGLPVVRYSAGGLHGEFGPDFNLIRHERETHQTPMGTTQEFLYCYCRVSEVSMTEPTAPFGVARR